MDDVAWMAVGLGAVYGLGTIVAALAMSADHYKGLQLVFLSLVWVPLLVIIGIAVLLQKAKGIGPVLFEAGSFTGTMRLGPGFRHHGIALVRIYTKEEREQIDRTSALEREHIKRAMEEQRAKAEGRD